MTTMGYIPTSYGADTKLAAAVLTGKTHLKDVLD